LKPMLFSKLVYRLNGIAMICAVRGVRAARTARVNRTVRQPARWYIELVTLTIEIEREDDGRWLAEVPALSGVMAYGQDRDEAVAPRAHVTAPIRKEARISRPRVARVSRE